MVVGATTPAAMACRKFLMHIAADQGAGPNLSFAAYVSHLITSGVVPVRYQAWVDQIRIRQRWTILTLRQIGDADNSRNPRLPRKRCGGTSCVQRHKPLWLPCWRSQG
jgi:hypothetical protein